MKKKLLFLILPVMLCLILFVGCTAPTGVIFSSPKWADQEELVYTVTSKEDGSNSELPIIVGKGEYVSKITKTTFEGKDAFELNTTFTFTGKYVAKDKFQSPEFTDKITTKCLFFNHSYSYLPITSERVAEVTELKQNEDGKYVVTPDKKLKYKITSESTFDFKNSTLMRVDSTLYGFNEETNEYDTPLKITNGTNSVDKKTTFAYKKPAENKAFFDNEQLFFGIRSLLSSSFTGQAIYVNTPFDAQISKLSLNKSKDENEGINKETGLVPVTIGSNNYNCMLFTLTGGQNASGIPIKLYFENEYGYKTEDEVTYKRNMLVKMVQGNLVFELKSFPNDYLKI